MGTQPIAMERISFERQIAVLFQALIYFMDAASARDVEAQEIEDELFLFHGLFLKALILLPTIKEQWSELLKDNQWHTLFTSNDIFLEWLEEEDYKRLFQKFRANLLLQDITNPTVNNTKIQEAIDKLKMHMEKKQKELFPLRNERYVDYIEDPFDHENVIDGVYLGMGKTFHKGLVTKSINTEVSFSFHESSENTLAIFDLIIDGSRLGQKK